MTIKICANCGLKFLTEGKETVCGQICSNEVKAKNELPNCVICSKRFSRNSASQKTCSKKCSHELTKQNAARYRDKVRPPKQKTSCERCNKVFLKKRKDQRFCCSHCFNQQYKRTVAVKPKPCVECGKVFQPRNEHNILCSKECRYINDKRRAYVRGTIPRMPGTLQPKQCLVCKKTYQPKAGSQKYCGSTCNGLVHLKRNRSKLNHNRKLKCWICKLEFKPKSSKSRAKFCSPECRAVYFNNKAKEKHKELKQEAKKQVEATEKWNDASVKSSELPADSMFPEEILAFIKSGGQITQYVNPVWVEGSKVSEYEDDYLTD